MKLSGSLSLMVGDKEANDRQEFSWWCVVRRDGDRKVACSSQAQRDLPGSGRTSYLKMIINALDMKGDVPVSHSPLSCWGDDVFLRIPSSNFSIISVGEKAREPPFSSSPYSIQRKIGSNPKSNTTNLGNAVAEMRHWSNPTLLWEKKTTSKKSSY